jgi:predicted phage tail protein
MYQGFDAVEEDVAVGSDVLEGLPITRTITDTNVDAARITINVPLLQTIKDNGDILGAEINLQNCRAVQLWRFYNRH